MVSTPTRLLAMCLGPEAGGLGPHDVQPRAAVQHGLGKGDVVRRGGKLHGVLPSHRHALHRGDGPRHQVQHGHDRNDQQAVLRHRAGEGRQQDGESPDGELIEHRGGDEQRHRARQRHIHELVHDQQQRRGRREHDHEPIGPDLRDHDLGRPDRHDQQMLDGPRFVEHLFPTCSVDVGGVRYHPVEIEKDGVVSLSSNHRPDLGLLHRSLPIEFHCGNASFWLSLRAAMATCFIRELAQGRASGAGAIFDVRAGHPPWPSCLWCLGTQWLDLNQRERAFAGPCFQKGPKSGGDDART